MADTQTPMTILRRIKYWYGQITRGIPYRVFNRLIHKFGFHYAPRNSNLYKIYECQLRKKSYKTYSYWCKWCGLRDEITDFSIEVSPKRECSSGQCCTRNK